MSTLPSISLTDLNRSIGLMVAALADHSVVVLTRYNKPTYAVLPLAVVQQFLRIAEQAARVRQQPDVLQLSDLLRTVQQLPVLAESEWLANCLADLSRESG